MTEATLAFSSPDQILHLFGTQDRYLRQVRDAVGVDVTFRGDEIRLHGTDEQIKRGLAIFVGIAVDSRKPRRIARHRGSGRAGDGRKQQGGQWKPR